MTSVFEQAEALLAIAPESSLQAHEAERAASVASCARALVEHGAFTSAIDLLDAYSSCLCALPRRELAVIATIRAQGLVNLNPSAALELAIEVLASADSKNEIGIEERSLLRAFRGYALWKLNRAQEAIADLEALRMELGGRADSRATVVCALQLSNALNLCGARSQAREMALEAWVAARRIGDRYWKAITDLQLSSLERERCRWKASIDHADAAASGFAVLANKFYEASSHRLRGIVLWKIGRVADAETSAAASISCATEVGSVEHLLYASLLMGLARLHRGKFQQAAASFGEARELCEVPASSRASLLTQEYLGDIDLEQGQAEPALDRYSATLKHALALVPRGDIVAELRRRIAECHLLLGRPQEALDGAREAIEHCREIHERYDEAASFRILGLAHAALGQHSEAKKAFDQGFAMFDDIETPYEWGKLWLSYGDWLSAEASGAYRSLANAHEAYRAAIDHFESMGAEYRLAQARAKFVRLEETMKLEEALPMPVNGKIRPVRRPRHGAEVLRCSQVALEQFGIVTRSRALLSMLVDIEQVAKSELPMMIVGESGTGKELVAQGVHALSGRIGEIVALNCSAIPATMLEAEIFGYVKGSFTGALSDKPGLFELADKGTLFLDEIGEMPLDLQAKLLRVLETGRVRRVGAVEDVVVRVRFVAATNRDRAAMEAGQGFRSDLFYRLAHALYELPPLRQRGDDVELLLDHFLALFNKVHGKRVTLSTSARERMIMNPWPGNVRQMRSVIEKMVVSAQVESVLTPREVPMFESEPAPRNIVGEPGGAGEAPHPRVPGALARRQDRRGRPARHLPHHAARQDEAPGHRGLTLGPPNFPLSRPDRELMLASEVRSTGRRPVLRRVSRSQCAPALSRLRRECIWAASGIPSA